MLFWFTLLHASPPFTSDTVELDLPERWDPEEELQARFPVDRQRTGAVEVTEVRRGDVVLADPGVAAMWDPASPALTLVLPWKALRGGEHRVKVAWDEPASPAPLQEEATLVVKVPTAGLVQPEAVKWDRVLHPFTGSGTGALGAVFGEATGDAPLRDLRVGWLGARAEAELACTVSGREQGGPDADDIDEGSTARLTCDTDGSWLGDATGRLLVQSADLPAPVTVAATVTTRLGYEVLFAVILAGVILTAVMNELATQVITRLEPRVRAERVLARARALEAGAADKAFREACALVADAAERALGGGATPPDSEVDGWVKGLEQARRALDQAFAQASGVLTNETPAWTAPRSLPGVVAASVRAAREHLDAARAELAAGNPTVANARLAEVRMRADRLETVISAWFRELKPAKWGAVPGLAGFARVVEDHRARLDAAAGVASRLDLVHAAWDPLDRGFLSACRALHAELRSAHDTLAAEGFPGLPLPPPAPSAADAERAIHWANEHLAPAHAAWVSWAAERVKEYGGDRTEARQALLQAIELGDWRVFAENLKAVARTPRTRFLGGSPLESETQVLALLHAGSPAPPPDAAPLAAGEGGLVVYRSALVGSIIAAGYAEPALRAARFAWNVVGAVVVTILGMAFFVDGWIGTVSEVIQAFAWGLGGQVTVGFIQRAASQLLGEKAVTPQGGVTGG